ncbi:MAG: hypothetical protein ACI3Z0_11415 [Candidatus Cryptobacteroides sp.]
MKKVLYATLALGALILASCQKENTVELPKGDSPVFTAHIDDGTKTVLNGQKSEWVSGDAIRVLNESSGSANYTTTDNGATATFTTATEGFAGTKFVALYPASPAGSVTWDPSYPQYIKQLWLKNQQTAVAGSYDSDAHLAYAYTDNNILNFKNMVALLKFTIAEGSKEVSSISVSVPKPESGNIGYLSGNFTYDSNNAKCYNEGGALYETVTLTGSFVAGQTYYMAVLPGTYSSLTLKVNDEEYKTKVTESVFNASKVYDLGSIDVQDEQKAIVMTIDKQNSWENLYIYAWDSSESKPFGTWPGTLVEGNTVTFPKTYYNGEINFILSTKVTDSNTVQTKDQKQTLTEDFTFTLPSEENYFVLLNTEFTDKDGKGTCPASNVYAWYTNNEGISITISDIWSGTAIADHTVYSYKYVELSSSPDTYNFILVNGGLKSAALITGKDSVTKGTTNYRF